MDDHLARECPNFTHCVKCAGRHALELCTSTVVKCANCSGSHWASSTRCPYWVTQVQQSRAVRNQQTVTGHEVYSLLEELKISHQVQQAEICGLLKSLYGELLEIKCSLSSLHPINPGYQEKQGQEMSWDDYDLNASEITNPDELSDADLYPGGSSVIESMDHHSTVLLTPASSLDNIPIVTNTIKPDNSKLAVSSQPSSPMVLKFVDSVNSNETKPEKNSSAECDTLVDAKFESDTCDINDIRNPENDPVFRDFYDRINEKAENEFDASQNLYEAFHGEVLYRYPKGKICPTMCVHTRDGTENYVNQCDKLVADIKHLSAEQIICCPFHVLAAEIRDNIDRDNFILSLKKWRTKDMSAWCDKWQSPFWKKYGTRR